MGTDDARKYIDTLFKDLPGRIEVRPLTSDSVPSKGDRCFARDARWAAEAAASAEAAGLNVFVGIATRTDESADQGRGKKEDLAWTRCCWADIDGSSAEADEKLAKFEAEHGLPASMVVRSSEGGGLHAYFFFDAPLDLSDPENLAWQENTNRGICDALGADRNAVDATRVLRVPGTTNRPNKKKRAQGRTESPCTLIREWDGTSYPLARFDDFAKRGETLHTDVDVSFSGNAAPLAGIVSDRVAALLRRHRRLQERFDSVPSETQQDVSPSGFDGSLAGMLAHYGVPVEEIAEVLAARRMQSGQMDSYRHDKMRRTAEKAVARAQARLAEPAVQPQEGMELPRGSSIAILVGRGVGGPLLAAFDRTVVSGVEPDTRIASQAFSCGLSSGQARELIVASRAAASGVEPATSDAIDRTISHALDSSNVRKEECHRPGIVVNNRPARHVDEEILGAISGAAARGEFSHEHFHVRHEPSRLIFDDGLPRTELLDYGGFAKLVAKACNPQHLKFTRAASILTHVPPPGDAVTRLRSEPEDGLRGWAPNLRGILSSPIVRSNGEILAIPGYDTATGYYYAPTCVIPEIPEIPTPAQLAEACALIDGAFSTFPFVDDASRVHAAYAAPLTILARSAIDGPTPAYLYDAVGPGMGKGLASNSAAMIGMGHRFGAMTLTPNEEETRKELTAILRGSPLAIRYDNVSHRIESESLAALITERRWQTRLLGTNEMVDVPCDLVVFVTANHIDLGPDMPRRSVLIEINAKMEDPGQRVFQHQDDQHLDWLRANRGRLLCAYMVLIRNWAAQGCPGPADGTPQKGSFAAWRYMIGGVLHAAGIVGFLQNEQKLKTSASSALQERAQFLAAWPPTEVVFTRDLLSWSPDLQDALPSDVAEAVQKQNLVALGKALRSHSDQPTKGLMLIGEKHPHNKIMGWRVVRVDAKGAVLGPKEIAQPEPKKEDPL